MDTSDPDISFDRDGICNHCRDAVKRMEWWKADKLPPEDLVFKIKSMVGGVKRAVSMTV